MYDRKKQNELRKMMEEQSLSKAIEKTLLLEIEDCGCDEEVEAAKEDDDKTKAA